MALPLRLPLALAGFTLLLSTTGASAQLSLKGAEVSAGVAGWAGDDFDGLEPGLQLQGTLMFDPVSMLDLGIEGTVGFVGLSDNVPEGTEVRQYGLGVRGRLALADAEALHVFLDGFVGWTLLDADVLDVTLREDGLSGGPGIGLHIPTRGPFSVVVATDIHYHSYSTLRLSSPGQVLFGETGTYGWRWSLRSGILFDGRR